MDDIMVLAETPDLEFDYLADFQQHKKVRQNLFYTLEGAETFYTYRGEELQEISTDDEYAFFARQPFWTAARRSAFVSLGCGNAGPEKPLLHTAHAAGKSVAYFGVDSSRAMLNLAQRNLAAEDFPRTFVLADFTRPDFVARWRPHLTGFDVQLYALLGGTFGNFEQDVIAEALARIVPAGHFLYLDVVPQYATETQNAQLRSHLMRLPQNLSRFFENLLEKLGLDQTCGELINEERYEASTGAWRYVVQFHVHEALDFPCFGGIVHLMPGESIELMNVRAYQPAALQQFLAGWGFCYVDTYTPDVGHMPHLWQRFLFQKKETTDSDYQTAGLTIM
ncbi:MAG TPA: class I SAM-dependent methyltransferase [Anaerolineae bacterium]|nr:class I SAM-dependent methyltransferase [Anaerolineae bacterium]HQH38918.1 class I SAM-dependent methyltransferase [Anaerolineae bacterium]